MSNPSYTLHILLANGERDRLDHVTSHEGDLVLDYYLGSGTTAVAAERLGRRWLGIDRNEETLREVTARRLAISPRPLDVV